ncbi:MAG: hypothetical protein ACREQQ_02105, partial [Candidatus Binatia bacterium]
RVPPSAEAYLPDSAAASLFADDGEMAALLGDLERKSFWAENADELKAEILRRSLAAVADFYRQLPVPRDAEWRAPARARSTALAEAHRRELRDRLERERAITAIVDTVLVYPTPHWAPREYQIDVVLAGDAPPAAFRDAVRAIRRSFGGRTFGIGGTHAQLTFVPRSAFEHPWYFLGTPFPLLHEHVASFGETLLGSPPRLPAPPAGAERLRWCRSYFLFHRFTLHRRPRYFSKDCNFCQLAAVRMFLEDGSVLTDAAEVRLAYRDRFVRRAEERRALDFLLRLDACPDGEPYPEALELQGREYDAVAALVGRDEALGQEATR